MVPTPRRWDISQAGIIDIEGSNPHIPTSFPTDSGIAIPIFNVLEVLGAGNVTTSGSGNTITITGIRDSQFYLTDEGTPPVQDDGSGEVEILGINGIVTSGIGPGNVINIGTDGSVATTYDGDTGSAIPVAGILNIIGDVTVETVAAGNTVTVRTSANGFPITPFVVGPLGTAGYQTIQAGLDAANAVGGGMVYVQPGSYTEDLTLYDNTHVVGVGSSGDTDQVQLTGVHSPPTTGRFEFRNIKLISSTHIYSSTDAGSAYLLLINTAIEVANGYSFNLPNWTGTLEAFNVDCSSSTDDGFFNNTGGATLAAFSGDFGAGTGNSTISSGVFLVSRANWDAPISFQTGSTPNLNLSIFNKTLTFANDSTGSVTNSSIVSGATDAVVMSSSGEVSLSSVVIDSSASPCISGSGAGTLNLENITYLDDSSVAATLTLGTSGLNTSSTFRTLDLATAINLNSQTISTTGSTSNINLILDPQGASFVEIAYATDHAIPVYGTGSILTEIGPLTNGQLVIGSTGVAPVASTLTAGTGITITNGAGSITIDASAATPLSFPTDSGTATPAANVLNVLGGTGVNTAGAGDTVTVNLDSPVIVANGGTGATSLTDGGIVLGSGTSPVTITSQPTDGELLIGSSGSDPVLATLTAGTGMTITEGSGSITLDATGGGLTWLVETGTTLTMAVNTGNIGNNAAGVTFTLPDTAAVGDIVKVTGLQASWTIAQNAGETIYFGSSSTTTGVGGSLASTDARDVVELVCVVANTDWQIISSIGNISIV